jgi:hypothetical protein
LVGTRMFSLVGAGNSELGNHDRGHIVRNPLPWDSTSQANRIRDQTKELNRPLNVADCNKPSSLDSPLPLSASPSSAGLIGSLS